MSLSRKILLLALLNFLLLAALTAAIARFQFGLQAEPFLLGPVRDRLTAMGNNFSMDYEATGPDAREELVSRWSRQVGADVYVTTPRGEWVAGPAVELPAQVIEQMRRIVPPPQANPPEPRRDSPPPLRGDFEPPRKQGPPPRALEPPRKDGEPPRQDGPPPGAPEQPRRDLPAESVFLVITHQPARYWAGVRIPLRRFGGERTQPGILLFRSASLFNRNLFFDWRLWVGAVAGVIAVSVLCWLPFIRGLTCSIAGLDRATKSMAQGDFDVQVAHRRRDELGDLGEQINRLGTQLGSFVRNQKRFLGDIAHELCAPIARIQFALGILEQKAEDSLRPHVAVLHDEVQEMSGLVNELLQFSKAGLQPHTAPLVSVDVASVVRRAALREPSPGGPFAIDVTEGLSAIAHEEYLLRALANLLRNAVRYAASNGPISVTARRERDGVAIRVADRGPGLPENQLEQVFAPFYRPEAARTRETGGAGLGLAIVKTCVEACGGTVAARNREGGGLEVTILLLP
jgi:two-component system sensor histidine kinase CpxA